MKRTYSNIHRLLLAALLALAVGAMPAAATEYRCRYVNGAEGAFINDGLSWATAKSNLQNAIDDLYEEIRQQADAVGYVFVAGANPSENNGDGMVYVPTRRATDDADGSSFNTAFRIYERIYVFGGFKGDETADDISTLPYQRLLTNGRTLGATEQLIDQDDIEDAVRRWNFRYKTILSGNHSLIATSFIYDTSRGRYTTSFPLNSYHVVWFGTNGTIDDGEHPGHFLGLSALAVLDGCTIREGNASSTITARHDHRGFGGGVYMVRNSMLRNCIVEHCAATQRGGGIYLDGGGTVERCYVHTCQASGIGVVQGYGGGIAIDYDGSVQHSYVIQSTARIGAGIAICHDSGDAYAYPEGSAVSQDPTLSAAVSSYSPFCTATVVANCTSTAEGGGIYLDQGGTLNHCTVVRCTCVGPDVVYYGRRHGRTGGIYVRTRGTLYNTVAWGNTSPVNNDVQFAAFKEQNAPASDIVAVYHCAFARHDITDWTAATKESVVSLTTVNTPDEEGATGNFPVFRQPTQQWGASTSAAGIQYGEGGVVDPTANSPGEPYQRVYNWHPLSTSALRLKSVQVTDALQGISSSVLHAHTDVDVVGRRFEAISSCGALAHTIRTFRHALVPSMEKGEEGTSIPTIFVDPNRKVQGQANSENSTGWDDNLEDNEVGDSWAHPAGNLPDAIVYFKEMLHEGGDEESTYYDIDGTHYSHVQIVVKEGSITTAGTGSYLGTQARTSAIRPASNMRLYGSIPTTNTGTDTSGRNQRATPTRVSANVLNSTYMNNGAHVFAIINQHDVIIDGFRLYSGNANLGNAHTYSTEDVRYGGGLIVNNTSRPQAERIDMRGNLIRNCVFSNCSAPEGAAIYVNGNNPKADGTLTRAELTVVNCIMRNSTAGDMQGDNHYFETHQTDGAVVRARGNAHLWLRNCDIVNNCGYALKATESPNYSGYEYSPNATGNCPDYPDRYQIEIYNSILFSNGLQITPDRTDIGQPVSCAWSPSIIGNYIYLDYDAEKPDGMPADLKCYNILTRTKSEDFTDNPNYVEEQSPDYLKKLRYPYFVNPSRNVGHSEDNDKPLYGGIVSYEPLNMNPIVNGANTTIGSSDRLEPSGTNTYNENALAMAYDAAWNSRNYGGAPDAGAVEDPRLPAAGAVVYVTPDGAGKRDGTSWANAIAGNTVYRLDNIAGPELAAGDYVDTEPTCDRILDANGNPVLTTDEKYCGGFAVSETTKNLRTVTRTTTINKKSVYRQKDNHEEAVPGFNDDSDFIQGTANTTERLEVIEDDTYNPSFPYGELSGQSRTIWRSRGNYSPIDASGNIRANESNVTNNSISKIAARTVISNDRTEKYVSGLQYAVEKAALEIGRVQVWVGNGTYTDYKGFVMRDRVTVLGGFPVSAGVSPGLSDRQALMADPTNSIDIPKSLDAETKNLNPQQYETILQISEKSPFGSNEKTFNSSNEVIKFQDNVKISFVNQTQAITEVYNQTETIYMAKQKLVDATSLIHNPTMKGDISGSWKEKGRPYKSDFYPVSNPGEWAVTNNDGSNSFYWVRPNSGSTPLLSGYSLSQTINAPEGDYVLKAWLRIRNVNQSNGVRLFASTSHGSYYETEELKHATDDKNHNADGNQYGYFWPFELKNIHVEDGAVLTIGVKVDNKESVAYSLAMTNFQLYRLEEAEDGEWMQCGKSVIEKDIDQAQSSVGEPVTVSTIGSTENGNPENKSALRKRVLYMPDVTMPTWSPGRLGKQVTDNAGPQTFEDFGHTYREYGHYAREKEANEYLDKSGHFKHYQDVIWDGFTIRHGYIYQYSMMHGGGAGVSIFDGATLQNCILYNNFAYARRMKGGGLFCDGIDATISNCFILKNTSYGPSQIDQIFAGGMFMYEGTCFNSLIAKNLTRYRGGGVGLCVGHFYNNTVAYNTTDGNGGGMAFATGAQPYLLLANTIIYGNNKEALYTKVAMSGVLPFIHCYIQSVDNISGSFTNAVGTSGINNVYIKANPNISSTPFEHDITPSGTYNPDWVDTEGASGGTKTKNNFRLRPMDGGCVNTGTEDFISAAYNSVKKSNPNATDEYVMKQGIYKAVYGVVLPDNDVAYADRIQDCEIDIGAYEYDGAKDIEPDLSEDGKAIFYVSQNGGGGLATASTPEDAACAMKLQKVLDAAGRWKYASSYYMNTDEARKYDDDYCYNWTNFSAEVLRAELTTGAVRSGEIGSGEELDADVLDSRLAELKNRTVIIKLAGDYTETKTGFAYAPTRSTNTVYDQEENLLEYSFIVPRGVQLWGGYTEEEVPKRNDDGTQSTTETWPAFSDQSRDVLVFPTRLSGVVVNEETGAEGNVFHVVTFTEDLFTLKERLFVDAQDHQLGGQLSIFDGEEGDDADRLKETNRAVLDGLFIQDGHADGDEDSGGRDGAGAHVTGYAHIRNCIVQDNVATRYGGGLYLEPQALVSGTIVKDNSAQQGGGIYVVNPTGTTVGDDTYAHIFTSTVVGNTATTTAGGLWFETNLRANSSAFWKNSANDLNNVAGSFTIGNDQAAERYPFVYCGVESQRISGVNNLLLPTEETSGVRWNHNDWWEVNAADAQGSNILYYPITMSSVLARSGMTYAAYLSAIETFPTLSETDLAGLVRMEQPASDVLTVSGVTREQKDNAFIEMGARVLNKTFEVVVDPNYIMTRLFVTTTEVLPSAAALALQENPNVNSATEDVRRLSRMYRQMGSSFANPFHRLGDAFEYIMKVRKETHEVTIDGVTKPLGEFYRDRRFEVFVTRGTFYPFRNAYGQQGDARTNTFVIPEGVTVVGGVDNELSGHWFCQEGYGEEDRPDIVIGTGDGSITLNSATTQEIRDMRERQDRNANSVREPWELTQQTVLSGNAVNLNDKTNVYHVITCYADEEQVGWLPHRYDASNNELSELTPTGIYTQPELLDNLHKESTASRDSRTIILDGMMIQEAHANDIADEDDTDEPTGIQKATQLTYFRGGGILVDGNWDRTFNQSGTMAEVLGVAKRDIPLLVLNCQFQNNQAGNGGAIYTNGSFAAVGCRFTQNTSSGPSSEADQKYIPWTAGGAVATNYECNLWNCLFDNNEAERGKLSISESLINTLQQQYGVNYTNSDGCQGSGGVVSASATSVVRILNCDMVRNKAVQYPAIYNHIDNDTRTKNAAAIAQYGPGRHYAVNTIFWGNEATADNVVMLDGSSIGERQPNHVANFGAYNSNNDKEMLFFCAYEDDNGIEATSPQPTITDGMTPPEVAEAQQAAQQLREAAKKARLWSTDTDMYADDDVDVLKYGYFDAARAFGTFTTGNGAVPYNHNQILSSDNGANNGPNFVLPTTIAGTNGYMENADWLVTRLNSLIDNGWSYLVQEVKKKSATSTALLTHFLDTNEQPIDDAGNDDELMGAGFYKVFSKNFYDRFSGYGIDDLLPIANERYMNYLREGSQQVENMKRISTYPRMGEEDVFIDIGVYEYQYVQLSATGDEVDVIWVGPETGLGNNGSTAQQCTSDLQGAIEALLLSRNGHDKMVKLKEGDYSPLRLTSNNKQAFFISIPTENNSVTMPASYGDQHLGVKSLTIRGGYSTLPMADNDDGEGGRDLELHPTVLSMKRYSTNTDDQLDHLFVIENAQQILSYGNFLSATTSETSDFTHRAVPIIFDGITFVNAYSENKDEEGGAALFYNEQYYKSITESGSTVTTDNLLQQPVELDPTGQDMTGGDVYHKLIIRDCIFVGNGAEGYGSSAVRIKRGGGQALVVNSLFHSNNGAPLDAVNTQVVNSTFALNAGHLTLNNVEEHYDDGTTATFPSQLHNSVIWKDDQDNGGTTQFSVPTTLYSGGEATTLMTNNTITAYANEDETLDQHNVKLDDNNSDVMKGPNFKDPKEEFAAGATADERQQQRLARDFHLKPSARIINRGSTDVYQQLVPYYPTYPTYAKNLEESVIGPVETTTPPSSPYARYRTIYEDEDQAVVVGHYWFHSVQRGSRQQPSEAILRGNDTTDHAETELSSTPRLKGSRVERGAYESTAAVERVLYVAIDGIDGADGTSWEHAFPLDHLQQAIDVASIYSLTSGTTPLERAYVFVKGAESAANGGNAVNVRDGVSVFGSLRMGFTSEAVKDCMPDASNNFTQYSDDEVARYVRQVQAARDGVATKGTTVSHISGLGSDNNVTPTVGFQLDGFWVDGISSAATPLVVDKPLTVLSNNVISGNTTTTAGQPIVNLQQGLLYNSLLFGNSTASGTPVVNVGANGYVLNCTVVGSEGQTLLGGDGLSTNVKNTIGVNEAADSRAPMFAPYQRPDDHGGNTAYSLADADALTSWQPYWYQLHEQSTQIDDGDETATVNAWLPSGLQPFVDFGHDRDVLGNPRRLGSSVDNGCFETWRVSGDRYATNQTNIESVTTSLPAVLVYTDYTDNYGGHRYPHAGSVVYLTEGSNLVLQMTGSGILRPGFLLAQAGASLYGQGYHIQVPYVAAEKALAPAAPTLTALPFAYGLDHAYSVSFDSSDGSISQTAERANFDAQHYDGEQRSHWRYHFHENDSECWGTALATDATIDACDGWLTTYKGDDTQTVRFTAWSNDAYVYEEDGTAKTVTLTQYDDRTATDGGADFTKLENMGWNLKGLPWLVSNYQTSTQAADGTYQMQVPHVVYSTLDGSNDTYGQFYTAQSWADGATLSLGNGFFTQTAAIADEETLTFLLPLFTDATAAPSRQQVGIALLDDDDDVTRAAADVTFDDVVDVYPQADADAAMPYRLGSDGIKWMAFDERRPQLYVANADGTRFSLATQAPVETEIALGLRLPAAGRYAIALPTPDAYAGYEAVWLIDHEAGTATDLLTTGYTLTTADGGNIATRLALMFGGQPAVAQRLQASWNVLKVAARGGRLPLTGVSAADDIRVYNAAGSLVYSGTVANLHKATLIDGVYIVKRGR